MGKFIKTKDNTYTYINVDYIVRIDYIPRENRLKEYQNEPSIVEMASGDFYKISIDDAEELLKNIIKTEKENESR